MGIQFRSWKVRTWDWTPGTEPCPLVNLSCQVATNKSLFRKCSFWLFALVLQSCFYCFTIPCSYLVKHEGWLTFLWVPCQRCCHFLHALKFYRFWPQTKKKRHVFALLPRTAGFFSNIVAKGRVTLESSNAPVNQWRSFLVTNFAAHCSVNLLDCLWKFV